MEGLDLAFLKKKANAPSDTILIEGELFMMKRHFFSQWGKKYVVITPTYLTIYQNATKASKGKKPMVQKSIKRAIANESPTKLRKTFAFDIYVQGGHYVFAAHTETLMKTWIKTVKQAVNDAARRAKEQEDIDAEILRMVQNTARDKPAKTKRITSDSDSQAPILTAQTFAIRSTSSHERPSAEIAFTYTNGDTKEPTGTVQNKDSTKKKKKRRKFPRRKKNRKANGSKRNSKKHRKKDKGKQIEEFDESDGNESGLTIPTGKYMTRAVSSAVPRPGMRMISDPRRIQASEEDLYKPQRRTVARKRTNVISNYRNSSGPAHKSRIPPLKQGHSTSPKSGRRSTRQSKRKKRVRMQTPNTREQNGHRKLRVSSTRPHSRPRSSTSPVHMAPPIPSRAAKPGKKHKPIPPPKPNEFSFHPIQVTPKQIATSPRLDKPSPAIIAPSTERRKTRADKLQRVSKYKREAPRPPKTRIRSKSSASPLSLPSHD